MSYRNDKHRETNLRAGRAWRERQRAIRPPTPPRKKKVYTDEELAERARKTKLYKQQHYLRHRERYMSAAADVYANHRPKHMVSAAKTFSKKHNLPFDIDVEHIESIWPVDNRCPIFGTEFETSKTAGHRGNTASMDRIVPSKGYTKGNVQIISFKANRIKCDASVDEIGKVYYYLKDKFG